MLIKQFVILDWHGCVPFPQKMWWVHNYVCTYCRCLGRCHSFRWRPPLVSPSTAGLQYLVGKPNEAFHSGRCLPKYHPPPLFRFLLGLHPLRIPHSLEERDQDQPTKDPRARKRTNEHQFTIEKLFESYGGSRYQGSADTEVFVQFLKWILI